MKVKNFTMKIDDLMENPKNPRKIKKEDLQTLEKSLTEFPEMKEIREVVIDENNTILGGHQRVAAMKSIGETEVYVKQVIGLSEEQKDEFIIKDNVQSGS